MEAENAYSKIPDVSLDNSIYNKKIDVLRVSKGTVLPWNNGLGGVLDENGKFVEASMYCGDWHRWGGSYRYAGKVHSELKVIFLGFIVGHWGHFLMECLGRAWILLSRQYSEYKVVLLKAENLELHENQYRMLELLGVDRNRIIFPDTAVQFDEVLIPELCTNDKYEFTKEFKQIFDAVKDNAVTDGIEVPENVYFSRGKYINAEEKEFGEAVIEDMFIKNGFVAMYPELLTLDHIIAIFQKASNIVCINGTIPLQIVFSHQNLNLIVLNKTSLVHMNLYEMAGVSGRSFESVDVYKEPIKGHPRYLGEGPFWICPTEELERYFEDHGMSYTAYHPKRREYIKYYYMYCKIKLKAFLISAWKKAKRGVVRGFIIRKQVK